MRNHILDYLSTRQVTVHQCRETQDAIQSASEVFVCNSLMGIVPVTAIEFSDGHRAYYMTDRIRELQKGVIGYQR
jgi:4-amino-4-deoxychorismate lyase